MSRLLWRLTVAAMLAGAAALVTASCAVGPLMWGSKPCKHRTQSGEIKEWGCAIGLPCCVSERWSYFYCGSGWLGCAFNSPANGGAEAAPAQ